MPPKMPYRHRLDLGPVSVTWEVGEVEISSWDRGPVGKVHTGVRDIEIHVDLPSGRWVGSPEVLAQELERTLTLGARPDIQAKDSPPAPKREGAPDLSKLRRREQER